MKPFLQNIIVRMPNWIGDLVMATPVLEDIKRAFPSAKLTVMVKKPLDQLLQYDPHVDEIFAFDKPDWRERHNETRDIIKKLQAGKYDAGVLLTNSFSSAYLFFRGKIPWRIGYAMHGRSLLLHQRLKAEQEWHQAQAYKKLLEPLGIKTSSTRPKLYLHDEERKAARELLQSFHVPQEAILLGINPGAAYGSAKCWPPEYFRELVTRLVRNKRVYVVFFGDVAGSALVVQIMEGLGPQVVNLAGKTSLRMLMALLEKVGLLLTNDSGPMHMADSLQTPLVALFGSTSAVKTGPSGTGLVVWNQVECSPCFKRTCPIDFRCMRGISVDQVEKAIQQELEKHGAT